MRRMSTDAGIVFDPAYICVRPPVCLHWPNTTILLGEEEWARVGIPGQEMEEARHRECIGGLFFVSRNGERVSPYYVDQQNAGIWRYRKGKDTDPEYKVESVPEADADV